MSDTPHSDDELIGYLLIHIWTLTTGRVPPSHVPPRYLFHVPAGRWGARSPGPA